MDIKGLDYNTRREPLLMPEYGREIQKMVDHAITLPTREERQRCAQTIVRLMVTKVPQLRENSDYEHTLWDHLYLMSHKKLDINWPYDVADAEKILDKPAPMRRPQAAGHVRLRHYGRLVEDLFERLKAMPEGAERDNKIKGALFLERILNSNSLITMSMSAGKSCPYNFAQGFMHFANGHILKGIKCFCTKIKVPALPKDKEEK